MLLSGIVFDAWSRRIAGDATRARRPKVLRAMRVAVLVASLVVLGAAALVCPGEAYAQDAGKTVRVGWYESPFNEMDQFGRRYGYAYDYQQKIANYTGWNYEYVEGSWSELMQMLIDGTIDMTSDISYADDRAELILYSAYPMGTEEYYLFISPNNTEYDPGDYSYFDGKRIGVNKGSVQIGLFEEWARKNDVRAELVELTCAEAESFQMLRSGELDAYITLDAFGGVDSGVPVVKIGSSDFFFGISKTRPDLQAEIDAAMSRIQDENRFYNQQLTKKYAGASGANLFLGEGEREWLAGHGTIRVGYQDEYLPFCDADKRTGELTGALKDYLDSASHCLGNAELGFQPVAYPSASAAIEALKNGEVDCMFPANLGIADSESLELATTPAMMTAEIYAIVRKDDQGTFSPGGQVVTAVVQGDPNADVIVKDHFPNWQTVDYPNVHACLKAVAEGKADCTLANNYRYNDLQRQCDKLRLVPHATGGYMDYHIAMRRGDTELYSILTRTTGIINAASVNAALASYATDADKTTLLEFIRENPVIGAAGLAVMLALLIVIVMQQRIIRARKEVEESHHQIDDLNRRVFVDALTYVRNKGGFNEYIQGLQSRLDDGELREFALVVLDCDNLKLINDRHGHNKGDEYLKAASRLICRVYAHSPVFRIGGDEFSVILLGEDFQNREELRSLFERSAEEINASAQAEWEQVNVSAGMAVYDPQSDGGVDDVLRRADETMYENKRARKGKEQVR